MNASSQLSRRLYFIVSFVIDAWDVMSESMILRRYMSVSLFIYLLIRRQEKPYLCQHPGTSCMHEVLSIWRLGLCTWLLILLCLYDFHSWKWNFESVHVYPWVTVWLHTTLILIRSLATQKWLSRGNRSKEMLGYYESVNVSL